MHKFFKNVTAAATVLCTVWGFPKNLKFFFKKKTGSLGGFPWRKEGLRANLRALLSFVFWSWKHLSYIYTCIFIFVRKIKSFLLFSCFLVFAAGRIVGRPGAETGMCYLILRVIYIQITEEWNFITSFDRRAKRGDICIYNNKKEFGEKWLQAAILSPLIIILIYACSSQDLLHAGYYYYYPFCLVTTPKFSLGETFFRVMAAGAWEKGWIASDNAT